MKYFLSVLGTNWVTRVAMHHARPFSCTTVNLVRVAHANNIDEGCNQSNTFTPIRVHLLFRARAKTYHRQLEVNLCEKISR